MLVKIFQAASFNDEAIENKGTLRNVQLPTDESPKEQCKKFLDQFPGQHISYYITPGGLSGWIDVAEDTVSGLPAAVEARCQLRVCNLESLWDVMNGAVPDEVYQAHDSGQTMPSGSELTASSIGEWHLVEDNKAWMNAEHIQEKLTAVPAGPGARDQLSESGVKIDHEAPLYAAITNAFYHPVNDCAKHLGYPLVYCQARGKKGATLADLRAINPLTQCTHIPHEVKAPCAEAYGDSDFPELVHDADNRKQMARPATQILYYMVEEGCVYGILFSKRNHIFLRRSTDATSCHVDFASVFDTETQTSPSLWLIYLYLLYLAKDAPVLDPMLLPSTPPDQKWEPQTRKRSRAEGEVRADQDEDVDKSDDDNFAGSEDDTSLAQASGPSAHTRSKVAAAKPGRMLHGSSKRQAGRGDGTEQAHLQRCLARLPIVPRNKIAISSTIKFGRGCVVREEEWEGQSAVYKVWDLGDSLHPLLRLQTEARAYHKLTPLQGRQVPRLLTQGQDNCGLQAFVATTRGGAALTAVDIKACPQLTQQALNALASVHKHGILHGEVSLHNCVTAPDCQGVWVLDFEQSRVGEQEEVAFEYEEFLDLIKTVTDS